MTAPDPTTVDHLADLFEEAWRGGSPPVLDEFLGRAAAAVRPAALRELVALDLEYRLRAGQAARVEEYLRLYPELAGDPAVVVHLAVLECRARRRFGEAVGFAEYFDRFPHLRSEFAGELSARGVAPDVPGYEVLSEIGRGGMGVVYTARQISLNRVVALKTIRNADPADQATLARFRQEAEAVARLKCPGVVQIYETGEAFGVPYFAMELCPGGGLDRVLAGGPLVPRRAAELVAAVARAVQAAHAVGLVHRGAIPPFPAKVGRLAGFVRRKGNNLGG